MLEIKRLRRYRAHKMREPWGGYFWTVQDNASTSGEWLACPGCWYATKEEAQADARKFQARRHPVLGLKETAGA